MSDPRPSQFTTLPLLSSLPQPQQTLFQGPSVQPIVPGGLPQTYSEVLTIPPASLTLESGCPLFGGNPSQIARFVDLSISASENGSKVFLAEGGLDLWVLPQGATDPSQWYLLVNETQAIIVSASQIDFGAIAIATMGGRLAALPSGMALSIGVDFTVFYTVQS